MLREVHIDKYNKIITQFRPQSLSSLNITQGKQYSKTAQQYLAIDDTGVKYQVYITEKDLLPIQDDLVFLQQSPKILLIKADRQRIIIQEHVSETLEDVLINREGNVPCAPFLQQTQARQLLLDLRISLQDYAKHSIQYSVIHPKNIVQRAGEWQLSLVGLLLNNERESIDYYKQGLPKDKTLIYTLGTLLFKVLFGFVPFEKEKAKDKFSFKDYIKNIGKDDNKKLLKVYYYSQRLLEVSQNAKQLIQRCLEGTIVYSQFYEHLFFKAAPGGIPKMDPASKEIKMISLFGKGSDQAYQSLVMAAIQRKKNYPLQKINQKTDKSQVSATEIIESFKKDPCLSHVVFSPEFKAKHIHQQQKSKQQSIPTLDLPYFYQTQFDVENDYPCRQLMKIIDQQSDSDPSRQAKIKLYAYPYAMIFQLYKYEALQPLPIRKKMRLVYDFLLQISSLQSPPIKPLHDIKRSISGFDQIKIKYRELINQLYHYFMAEAMKKYNIKKDSITITEKMRQKHLGLQYYRLCLKLLEASLIIRKQGRDLDLQRIETSQRKEIQSDLTHLLKQYFPNKVEIY